MSKWQEHPLWSDDGAYDFLNGASVEVWAWEFLRRSDKYCKDWKRISQLTLQERKSQYDFIPPLNSGESEQKWLRRCVANGLEPQKMQIDRAAAKKWGLEKLCDPKRPFEQGVQFLKKKTGLIHILTLEDFEQFLTDETLEDGQEIQIINSDFAIFAVDLRHSTKLQARDIEKAASL